MLLELVSRNNDTGCFQLKQIRFCYDIDRIFGGLEISKVGLSNTYGNITRANSALLTPPLSIKVPSFLLYILTLLNA